MRSSQSPKLHSCSVLCFHMWLTSSWMETISALFAPLSQCLRKVGIHWVINKTCWSSEWPNKLKKCVKEYDRWKWEWILPKLHKGRDIWTGSWQQYRSQWSRAQGIWGRGRELIMSKSSKFSDQLLIQWGQSTGWWGCRYRFRSRAARIKHFRGEKW